MKTIEIGFYQLKRGTSEKTFSFVRRLHTNREVSVTRAIHALAQVHYEMSTEVGIIAFKHGRNRSGFKLTKPVYLNVNVDGKDTFDSRKYTDMLNVQLRPSMSREEFTDWLFACHRVAMSTQVISAPTVTGSQVNEAGQVVKGAK